MNRFRYSIKGKILLPFLFISFLFLVIIQLVLLLYLNNTFTDLLDKNLRDNTHYLHDTLGTLLENSISSYLRGITEQDILIFEDMEQQLQNGIFTEEQLKDRAEEIILAQKISKDGYCYVTDSQGLILIHPDVSLIGEYSIFAEQFQTEGIKQSEYTEYDFQGREKVLYRTYFEPWDWVIAATAYKEDFHNLIDLSENNLEILKNQSAGINFILDSDGEVLINTQGQDVHFSQDIIDTLKDQSSLSTVIELDFEEHNQKHRVFFSWIEDFDWYIGSSIPVNSLYKPIMVVSLIISVLSILQYISIFLLLMFIIRRFTLPLDGLILKMEENDSSTTIYKSTKEDEIQILEHAFYRYLDRLRLEELRAAKANDEIRILARFPNELQFPVIRLNQKGEVSFLNPAADKYKSLFLENDESNIKADLLSALKSSKDKKGGFEYYIEDKDFRVIPTYIQSSAEFYLHIHDETMINQFKTLQSIWANVFESSQEGIVLASENGIIEQVNQSFIRITGYSKSDIAKEPVNMMRYDVQDSSFFKGMWQDLNEMGRWQGEIWNKRKNGEIYKEWLSINRFQDSHSGEFKFMAIFHDLSDLHQKEQELEHMTHYDSLTDLPNRLSFYKFLSNAISQRKNDEKMAIMLLDIDNYSMISNYMGSNVADEYLRKVSLLFKDLIRNKDILARVSTSEFVLLLTGLQDISSCHLLINRIKTKLDRTIEIEGQNITPLVNMGISLFPANGNSADILIRRARLAMQQARMQRRGSHHFFDLQMEQNAQNLFDLDSALKNAFKHREFRVVYQPKIDLNNDKVLGFEALLRWERPGVGFVSPNDFIPLLEENGLIIEVGEWLIGEVCRFINNLSLNNDQSFHVAINVSAKQFADRNFIEHLFLILKDHGISHKFIELEITENIAALEIEGVVDMLQLLRDQDISIALDDFGTGYSSLAYLRELPFDSLKIDRSFVEPIDKDRNSLAIFRSILTLAHSMGKSTVAEGVETETQREICRIEGCDILQGFLTSPPVSQEEAQQFYIKNSIGNN